MKLQFIHIGLSIPYFWKSRFCNEGENSPRQFHRMQDPGIGLRFRLVQHQYNLLISLVKNKVIKWEITMSDDWIRWEWQKLMHFFPDLFNRPAITLVIKITRINQTVIHSWLRLSETKYAIAVKGQLQTGIECNRRRNTSASTIFSPESGYSSNTWNAVFPGIAVVVTMHHQEYG